MSIIRLIGSKDAYLFDPANADTVLSENGKFGHVYAGARESDKHPVVIKHLNPKLLQYPYALLQFRYEADAALDHPFIRKTMEYIEVENHHFLVQDYIRGHELKVFLMRQPKFKQVTFIVKCMLNILSALEYIHSRNIVHCDIKPSNILLREPAKGERVDTGNPQVVLIDLGNARTPLSEMVVTVKPFSFIYSPPEQVLHLYSLVGPHSDLFALGVTTYELITGQNAYATFHPEKLMHLQVSGELVADPSIPPALFTVLQKATARKKFPLPPNQLSPDERRHLVEEGIRMRYPDAVSFRDALLEFLAGYKEKKGLLRRLFR